MLVLFDEPSGDAAEAAAARADFIDSVIFSAAALFVAWRSFESCFGEKVKRQYCVEEVYMLSSMLRGWERAGCGGGGQRARGGGGGGGKIQRREGRRRPPRRFAGVEQAG